MEGGEIPRLRLAQDEMWGKGAKMGPRIREDTGGGVLFAWRPWIPAFAGMTRVSRNDGKGLPGSVGMKMGPRIHEDMGEEGGARTAPTGGAGVLATVGISYSS